MSAILSYKTFLMHKTALGSSYEKLIDIVTMPQIGGEPEQVDVTTLSDPMHKYIKGIQDSKAMPFECIYDKADYDKIKALEDKQEDYAIWMGATGTAPALVPTGSEGKFKWKGDISVYINDAGVNDPHKMTVTCVPSTTITEDAE